jgi:hypothetical protein
MVAEHELETPHRKDARGVGSIFPLAAALPNVNRVANTDRSARGLIGFEPAPPIRHQRGNR